MIFLGYDISGIVTFLKVLGFIFSLLFAIGIVLSFLGKKKNAQKKKEIRNNHFNIIYEKKQNGRYLQWENIKNRFQSKNPTDWRMAIIDADAMLEKLIDSLGYQGSSFGEKLKSIQKTQIPFIDDIWYVHKLRNNLAHQGSSYHLSERETFQVFKIYENIFHTTGYLNS